MEAEREGWLQVGVTESQWTAYWEPVVSSAAAVVWRCEPVLSDSVRGGLQGPVILGENLSEEIRAPLLLLAPLSLPRVVAVLPLPGTNGQGCH